MTDHKSAERERIAWHHDKARRCLNCHEHGAPYDGGCQWCGYADPRWCKPNPADAFGLWEAPHDQS